MKRLKRWNGKIALVMAVVMMASSCATPYMTTHLTREGASSYGEVEVQLSAASGGRTGGGYVTGVVRSLEDKNVVEKVEIPLDGPGLILAGFEPGLYQLVTHKLHYDGTEYELVTHRDFTLVQGEKVVLGLGVGWHPGAAKQALVGTGKVLLFTVALVSLVGLYLLIQSLNDDDDECRPRKKYRKKKKRKKGKTRAAVVKKELTRAA